MDYSLTLRGIKKGLPALRRRWNGKNMWVCYRSGFSMSQGESDYSDRFGDDIRQFLCEQKEIQFLPSFCMWTVDSTGRTAFLTGWLASQSDMDADDWEFVDLEKSRGEKELVTYTVGDHFFDSEK